jgi:[acyl-carrier-protein] S-malonyltransferase
LPAPALFDGYSVGELAAYGCVRALSAGGVLRLAMRRAALMDGASREPSGLVAIRGLEQHRIEALCSESGAEIAIVNGPDHFILGAPVEGLDMLTQTALAQGAHTARRLRVAVAAHTSLLASASREFALVLEQSDMADPATPVLAGINGAPVRERATALAILAKQLSTTVDWQACVKTALEMGCRVFLELGPGGSLARMVRDIAPEVAVRSVEEFRSLEGVADWITKQMQRA